MSKGQSMLQVFALAIWHDDAISLYLAAYKSEYQCQISGVGLRP